LKEGKPAAHAYSSTKSPFAPAAEEPLLARTMPVSKRLAGYRSNSARRDFFAGLTVAV